MNNMSIIATHSVNIHIPPTLYIDMLGMCQQISASGKLWAYGPASRSECMGRVPPFKCIGRWVFILAHGPVPLLWVVWLVYIYIWMFISNGPKIVIVAHISNWDSSTCSFHRGLWICLWKMLIMLVAPTITGIVIVAPKVDLGTFSDCISSTCTWIGFHKGLWIWSPKILIVPVALTITGIVIVALEVHHVTSSNCDGLTFIFTVFHEGCWIHTELLYFSRSLWY
jgi:hypothetical protein